MQKTILIVDDFETSLFTIATSLKTNGYQVIKASSAEDAIKKLDGRNINLVISDFNMPGMNGADLSAYIRATKEYRTMPILILSTDTSSQKKEQAKLNGATGWMNKPFNLNDLLKVANRLSK